MKMLLCFFMLLLLGLDVSLSKHIRNISKKMEKLEETNEELNSKLDNLVEQTNMTQAKFEATNMELKTFKNESQAQLDAANIKFESFKNESETNVKSLGENITNQHEELNSKLDNLVEQTNMTQAQLDAANIKFESFKNESEVIQTKLESIDSKLKLIVENHECYEYNTLSEADRGISSGNNKLNCDQAGYSSISPMWKGASWYRFLPPAGTILSLSTPGRSHCGTSAVGWTNGTLPTVPGSTLNIKICFDWDGNQCTWNSAGRVTNCGTYYVYYLENTPTCNLRYCGAN